MRSYVVRQGDSPASISATFAGCPKCSVDLVAANPQKPAVRYPNGFVTFKTLQVGEQLALPDKWFNGALDAAPKAYFDGLPSADGGVRPRSPAPATSGQGVTCRNWTLGGTIEVGSTKWPALNPSVSVAAYHQAAQGAPAPYTMWIGGRLYLFRSAPPPVLSPASNVPSIVPMVEIYFCSRFANQPAHPGVMGVGGPPPPGTVPTPPSGGPPQAPCCYTFQPQESYVLVVWPIPQGPLTQPDPTTILTDLGFTVLSVTNNGDGSYTAAVVFNGSSNMALNVSDAESVLVFTDGAPVISPSFGTMTTNAAITIPYKSVTINLPPNAQWLTAAQWSAAGGPIPPPGQVVQPPFHVDAPASVSISGPTNLIGLCNVGPIVGGTLQSMQIYVTPYGGATQIFQPGETVAAYDAGGTQIGTATVSGEYDAPNGGEGTLLFSNETGLLGGTNITLVGQTSGASAMVKYQYTNVLNSPKGNGLLGVSRYNDQGTSLQLPYNLQSGDIADMTVLPTTDSAGLLPDMTVVLKGIGLDFVGAPVQNADCSWNCRVLNQSGAPIEIDSQIQDSTGAMLYLTALSVSGNVVLPPPPPLQPIGGPTMTACSAFSMKFLSTQCQPIQGGTVPGSATDPTAALGKLGITNAKLTLPGPDPSGEWEVKGVWELGSGFVLPQSPDIVITDFQDLGPATSVATGPCATSLPYTLQPGDSVNMIVRPVAAPGQPMTNPVAVMEAMGFTNVAPASTYSDCTWVMTGDYTGPKPLQIIDPMVSAGVGAMWVVGLSVNGTVVKEANWIQLQPIDGVTIESCHQYTVFFTFETCPALTGAPGSWDPTTALTTILPGFKLAPGPNEYGEWSATGLYSGADAPLQGSGGITFTWLVDYGKQAGCIPSVVVSKVPCPPGQVRDLGTQLCVAACSDGSAPTNGVCGTVCPTGQVLDTGTGKCAPPCTDGSAPNNGICQQPVKATPPVTPPAGTSTGAVVAVGAAAVGAGLLAWLFFL